MRFSFGKNWKNFLDYYYSDERLATAVESLRTFLGKNSFEGLTVMDVGCGSGIFSLAAFRLKAERILSFDIDPFSVKCCEELRKRENNPEHWETRLGSILDKEFLNHLPKAGLVYSWGVLHHTGALWEAIENAASKVEPGGYFFIAVYNKVEGPLGSVFWLRVKRLYNALPRFFQYFLEIGYMTADIAHTLSKKRNPIKKIKSYKSCRGMSWRTDIIDWLGGYPYEYANAEEVVNFCVDKLGLSLITLRKTATIGNNEFLFKSKTTSESFL